VNLEGVTYSIQYEPGDSTSDFFGGNSNWRGPVWMPVNYLIIQSLKKYGEFYDGGLKVEYPTGSGNYMELTDIVNELIKRNISLFQRDEQNHRQLHGKENWFYSLPENRDLLLFYEYFHGDNGKGLGASHQTGWTALIAKLITELSQQESRDREQETNIKKQEPSDKKQETNDKEQESSNKAQETTGKELLITNY